MKSKREEAWVGLFVLVAIALSIVTIWFKSGPSSSRGIPYHTYLKTAGGLHSGAKVRYGGMDAGKVEEVRIDPQDSTRIEIDFRVQKDIPVKIDSVAKTAALGALGENYLEVGTGKKDSALAPPGSELKSVEAVGIAELGEVIGGMAPKVNDVLENLNQRLKDLAVTENRVNDLLNDKNRANVSSGLGNLNSILSDSRPKFAASLTNVQAASAKLLPIMDNFNTTLNKANEVLSHLDPILVENHDDIRAVVVKMKEALTTGSSLMEQLKNTTDNNSENIDQIILNLRVTTENVRELTDSLKKNPSLIVRGTPMKDRKPGDPAK